MSKPILQLKDGFASYSPHLREDVRKLQASLEAAGYDLDTDGLFGAGTEQAVKAFQRERGLVADGIVGPNTWAALDAIAGGAPEDPAEAAEPAPSDEALLPGFHGDLSWVHAREGHAGKTYWPGGASGVTLDPGVDLGHARPALVAAAYQPLLSPEQFAAVQKVLGIKGRAAKSALRADPVLAGIRISKQQADTIFKYAAQPYWRDISKRFPGIKGSDVPGAVQTVMLSLAYNRGAGNRALGVLDGPIRRKDWATVADQVGSMQQDHRLSGIRRRRRMEGDLIRKAL